MLFDVVSKKIIAKPMSRRFSLVFCSVNLYEWYKMAVQFFCFAYEYPVYPTPFFEKTIIYPGNIFGFLVIYLFTIWAWASLWALNSVPVVFVPVFMLLWLLKFCYSLKSGNVRSPRLFFFKITLATQGFFCSFIWIWGLFFLFLWKILLEFL